MKVAELKNNFVWSIYDAEKLPLLAFPGGAVDITGLDPEPSITDKYNSVSGLFELPEADLSLPVVGTVDITAVTGAGLVNFETKDDGSYLIRAIQGLPLSISATNSGPAGTWTMPIETPTHVGNVTVTKVGGDTTMTIAVTPDQHGTWRLTEDLINRDLFAFKFNFEGLTMEVVMPGS